MSETSPVWLFDGTCMLCSGAVRHTLRRERPGGAPIRFVALQSSEGRALAEAHGLDPDDPQSFLFVEDGRAWQNSDGVIRLARHWQGPTGWLRHGRLVPRPLRDALYRFVARHRYRLFGRSESCMVPTAETRARFVLP